jgi:ribosomal protein S18 acetylase RimI-like enzyme
MRTSWEVPTADHTPYSITTGSEPAPGASREERSDPRQKMISELTKERLDDFFHYLDRHVAENGSHATGLFLPLDRSRSNLSDEMRSKFEHGLNKVHGENGWRRTWIAQDQQSRVVGHADIRANDKLYAGHRVVLGMGVDRDHRGRHIGLDLLMHTVAYCRTVPGIDWIDLEVLATNTKAINLYRRAGFQQVGMIEDMFRIDGVPYDHVSMALNVER